MLRKVALPSQHACPNKASQHARPNKPSQHSLPARPPSAASQHAWRKFFKLSPASYRRPFPASMVAYTLHVRASSHPLPPHATFISGVPCPAPRLLSPMSHYSLSFSCPCSRAPRLLFPMSCAPPSPPRLLSYVEELAACQPAVLVLVKLLEEEADRVRHRSLCARACVHGCARC